MRIVVIIVLVLLLLAAAGWWTLRGATRPAAWQTQTADSGELVLKVSATGTVEPVRTVQVGSQVSGIVKEVRVEADQTVQAGQVLAMLDTELLEAERRDGALALARAKLDLDALAVEAENLNLREAQLTQSRTRARIELDQARDELGLARRNLERWQDMANRGAVEVVELDARKLAAENAARAVCLKDEVALPLLEVEARQIVSDRAALELRRKQAATAVEQAQQNVAKAQTHLDYATITAPIGGVVLERTVDPGQTIAASFQTPNLFRIAEDLRTVRITARIDEADIGRMREGLTANFEVDAFRGERFEGKVIAVRLRSELRGNVVTYPVLIDAPNPPAPGHPHGHLRPGMTAYLTFEVGRKQAIRLPAAALRFAPPDNTVEPGPLGEKSTEEKSPAEATGEGGRKKGVSAAVYTVAENGRLRRVPVRVGETDGEHYELLSGAVKPGDALVTGAPAK